jgi:hypothetical protein
MSVYPSGKNSPNCPNGMFKKNHSCVVYNCFFLTPVHAVPSQRCKMFEEHSICRMFHLLLVRKKFHVAFSALKNNTCFFLSDVVDAEFGITTQEADSLR